MKIKPYIILAAMLLFCSCGAAESSNSEVPVTSQTEAASKAAETQPVTTVSVIDSLPDTSDELSSAAESQAKSEDVSASSEAQNGDEYGNVQKALEDYLSSAANPKWHNAFADKHASDYADLDVAEGDYEAESDKYHTRENEYYDLLKEYLENTRNELLKAGADLENIGAVEMEISKKQQEGDLSMYEVDFKLTDSGIKGSATIGSVNGRFTVWERVRFN